MQDNFDLKGYLRNGNKLLNEGIGGYMDLRPINELEGQPPLGMPETDDTNPWMEKVDGNTMGYWKCYYDYPGHLVWAYADVPLDELAVYATPNFDMDDKTPIQVDVDNDTVENMTINKGTFADFNEYAETMKDYLDQIEANYEAGNLEEGEPQGDQYDGKYDDEYGPEEISEEEDYEEEDSVYAGRAFDIAGHTIEQGIADLINDGFSGEDVIEFCTLLAHAQAEGEEMGPDANF